MSLENGDLKNTVLKKISIDEFEPKSGTLEDTVVLALFVVDEEVGQDMYKFFNTSSLPVQAVDVSPNPNEDDYFVVFVELPRNDQLLSNIRKHITDLENLTGRMAWVASTHLTDDFFPLDGEELEQYVITDPENYMSREEWEAQQEMGAIEEAQNKMNWIADFLKNSSASVKLDENILELSGVHDSASFNIVAYGEANQVMESLGIHNKAIKPLDINFRKLNIILGEMRAVPIDDYIVIFHPEQNNIIVGEICI
jgi:hypothetical protein